MHQRIPYIQFDVSRSKIMVFGPYGVIQGSKLSGILYSIYTTEVPRLHRILFNTNMMRFILQRKAFSANDINMRLHSLLMTLIVSYRQTDIQTLTS